MIYLLNSLLQNYHTIQYSTLIILVLEYLLFRRQAGSATGDRSIDSPCFSQSLTGFITYHTTYPTSTVLAPILLCQGGEQRFCGRVHLHLWRVMDRYRGKVDVQLETCSGWPRWRSVVHNGAANRILQERFPAASKRGRNHMFALPCARTIYGTNETKYIIKLPAPSFYF